MCYECNQARKNGYEIVECRLQVALDGVHAMMAKPGYKPYTSSELKLQADSRRSIATAIKLNGGEVKDEYR